MMKKIGIHGISHIEQLSGDDGWYWGTDYTHGDLYEAEDIFKHNHSVKCNRLVFVHYPDGRVVEPIEGKEGQYFGRPIFFDGKLQILLVDFPKSLIQIFQYDDATNQVVLLASLPLTETKDCYNLLLFQCPLMLTRQGNDGKFQVVWPENLNLTSVTQKASFIGMVTTCISAGGLKNRIIARRLLYEHIPQERFWSVFLAL